MSLSSSIVPGSVHQSDNPIIKRERMFVNSLMKKTGFKNRVELAVNVTPSGLVIDE